MRNIYAADYVFPVSSDPVRNGAVAVDNKGTIIDVYLQDDPRLLEKPVKKLNGIIVPGFVNAHCHLELSHLQGKVKKHTGLIPFLSQVIKQRSETIENQVKAMEQADAAMWERGIVAVGDIVNSAVSKAVKERSRLYYHSFVELIGFNPAKAKEVFRAGLNLKEQFGPLPASIAPHAPYSVSKKLFRFIDHFCRDGENALTIHNQESEEENRFYRYKAGNFLQFYEDLNIDISFFKPQARNSLQSVIPLLSEKQHTLLVHNTYTSLKDIYFLKRLGRDITWCFCPNANLYIENRLPKIDLFLLSDFNITIGTDSLASNDKLCILSELKTLHKNFPLLEFIQTIKWATLNGARFLKIDRRYGSIEKGKAPGLNLITHTNGLGITEKSEVRRLV